MASYRLSRFMLIAIFLCCSPHLPAQASSAQSPNAQTPAAQREGQHDFDFEVGTWRTHLKRLQHPLTGSTTWIEYEGTTVVRKVWNGRANLAELEAEGPTGHLEVLSLRLYNPQAHQWSLYTANSKTGSLSVPTIGEFNDGRGEFFDTEPFNGRSVLVRNVWSDITANSCRFEQSFSTDGGKTWEVNWIATDTRADVEPKASVQPADTFGPGQHDFDFELGTWDIHLNRRLHPLTGSNTWVKFDGTSVTRKVWDGRSQIEEFETDGAAGHIEGLTLRLYDPQSHQWSLYWANSKDGIVVPAQIGEFKNGVGEFYAQDTLNGKSIFIRFIWSKTNSDVPHFEQSFSDDGGKTWEVNWITDQTRTSAQSAKSQ